MPQETLQVDEFGEANAVDEQQETSPEHVR